MPFVTDSDVEVLHTRLASEWTTIESAATGNSAKLTPELLATLGTLATRVSSYLGDAPSLLRAGVQMTTGESLERDVFSFADGLRDAGVPGLPMAPSEGPKTALDKIVDLAPWALVALLALEYAPRPVRAFARR